MQTERISDIGIQLWILEQIIQVNFPSFFVLPLTPFQQQLIYNIGTFNVVQSVPCVAVQSVLCMALLTQLQYWEPVLLLCLKVVSRTITTRS